MTREYDKLVRDDIPAIIERDGETPVTHTADDAEYERRLFDKLDEEASELRAADTETALIDELADVLSVVHAVRRHAGLDADRIDRRRAEKAAERGRFDDRVVLDRVEP